MPDRSGLWVSPRAAWRRLAASCCGRRGWLAAAAGSLTPPSAQPALSACRVAYAEELIYPDFSIPEPLWASEARGGWVGQRGCACAAHAGLTAGRAPAEPLSPSGTPPLPCQCLQEHAAVWRPTVHAASDFLLERFVLWAGRAYFTGQRGQNAVLHNVTFR